MKLPKSDYTRPESVFVLEVAGVPTLAFQAVSIMEARGLPREEWLRNDLRQARSKGAALWNGTAKITVRHADADETARFVQTKAAALNGSDDLALVYLVDLD